jgi:hypothetical protein
MRKLSVFLLCIVLLASCNQNEKPPKQDKTFLILFDVSLSVANHQIRAAYESTFRKIFAKVEAGDILLVGYINDKSLNQLELPVIFYYNSFIPSSDNDMIVSGEKNHYDSTLSCRKDSIYKVVDSILMKVERKVLYTDIFSSLILAEKLFNQYPRNKSTLVIFSDMEEDTPQVNFTKENMNDQHSKDILEKQKKDNLLPNLDGVKVFVIGATSADYKKREQIESFWLRYFRACNADLAKKNYCTVLANFEL